VFEHRRHRRFSRRTGSATVFDGEDLDVRKTPEHLAEAGDAIDAGLVRRNMKHDDPAGRQSLGEAAGCQPARLAIVGEHLASNAVTVRHLGIDHHAGNSGVGGVSQAGFENVGIDRIEKESPDAAGNQPLDFVLLSRRVPVGSLRFESITVGFDDLAEARVHLLKEWVVECLKHRAEREAWARQRLGRKSGSAGPARRCDRREEDDRVDD
jgi:hypothetical protein